MDVNSELEKVKFHIQMLAETVDYREHPIASLVVEFDWNKGQLERAHDIFEGYSKRLAQGEKPHWRELEGDLKREFGIGYQSVKSIVNAFYYNAQWEDVCYWFAAGQEPMCPTELSHIVRNRNCPD